jgi:hypothetical protein
MEKFSIFQRLTQRNTNEGNDKMEVIDSRSFPPRVLFISASLNSFSGSKVSAANLIRFR